MLQICGYACVFYFCLAQFYFARTCDVIHQMMLDEACQAWKFVREFLLFSSLDTFVIWPIEEQHVQAKILLTSVEVAPAGQPGDTMLTLFESASEEFRGKVFINPLNVGFRPSILAACFIWKHYQSLRLSLLTMIVKIVEPSLRAMVSASQAINQPLAIWQQVSWMLRLKWL